MACSKDAPKTQKLGKIVALGRFCNRYTSDGRRAHCFISHNPVRDSFGVADHLEGGETSQYKGVYRERSANPVALLPVSPYVRYPKSIRRRLAPFPMSTIFPASIRLQKWMNQTSNVTWAMTDQNRQISAIFGEQRSRLRNFIRRRVPDPRDAEDILQDAFYKLVEANRLLMPIDHVTSWLFRVARNRITDLFRKKKPETFSHASVADEDGELLQTEDLLPSPDAGPEALYVRNALLDQLELALDELPEEQREVFVAHELDGRSFKELAAETGVSVNTLLSRKRYAVLHLRERLQSIYDEFTKS